MAWVRVVRTIVMEGEQQWVMAILERSYLQPDIRQQIGPCGSWIEESHRIVQPIVEPLTK